MQSILWQRLESAGHDACRLIQTDRGWRLEGTTTFLHEREPACLIYEVDCDKAWRTQEGVVWGWAGTREVDLRIAHRSDGAWTVNGRPVAGLEDCVDLDFGFTPATNLFQIRRIALQVGQAADVPVAWFDVPGGTLEKIHQKYERRTVDTYWYESPRFQYAALLQVNTVGFVEKYPGLWEVEK
jgi:hypothetical protein